MVINDIELLAAKYLEIGGMGRLDDNRHFVRDLDRESPEAISFWNDPVVSLSAQDLRRFEFLVSELRLATN